MTWTTIAVGVAVCAPLPQANEKAATTNAIKPGSRIICRNSSKTDQVSQDQAVEGIQGNECVGAPMDPAPEPIEIPVELDTETALVLLDATAFADPFTARATALPPPVLTALAFPLIASATAPLPFDETALAAPLGLTATLAVPFWSVMLSDEPSGMLTTGGALAIW